MKNLLLTAMVMGALLFSNTETKAQVRIGVNVNIGTRPSWGLPGNSAANYYYMPEIDTYYDIPHRQFIYLQGNNWTFASELPAAYRGYDLNRGYKVAVNENRPYLNNNVYRTKYSSYYNNYHRQNNMVVNRPGYNNNNRFDDHKDAQRNDRNDRFNNNDRNNRNDQDNDRGKKDDHNNGRDDKNPRRRG